MNRKIDRNGLMVAMEKRKSPWIGFKTDVSFNQQSDTHRKQTKQKHTRQKKRTDEEDTGDRIEISSTLVEKLPEEITEGRVCTKSVERRARERTHTLNVSQPASLFFLPAKNGAYLTRVAGQVTDNRRRALKTLSAATTTAAMCARALSVHFSLINLNFHHTSNVA